MVKTLETVSVKIGGNAIGIVYVNEVADNPEHGSNPVDLYEKGQTVQVKVIGAKVIASSFR